mmetsp:Transcript_56775/g.132761  ORF Transcript_56775/g.132761 Transcript_56775/m.132761 type:complete len:528 (+) Transcript_56775:75-1658(+)
MLRPGTRDDTYEDYQRDVERFQQRRDGGAEARSASLPPDFLGEERGLRSSHLTHLGGFRREYLHRKRKETDEPQPTGTEETSNESGDCSPPVPTTNSSSYLLALEIQDQMSYIAFFVADIGDDELPGRQTRLLVDSLPPPPAGPKKKMSLVKACFSTFKAFIATGILFMPQAVTNAGWGWAVILMSGSCVISTCGVLLLGECHQNCNLSYPLMGRKAYGGWGYFLIAGQVALSQFGFCTSYFIFMSSTLRRVFETWNLAAPPTGLMLLGIALLLTPLGWIRRISRMKVSNLIGDAIILFAIGVVAVAAVSTLCEQGVSPEVVAFAPPERVLVFAGTAVYAFEGIALVIPIREGMERPELFSSMLVGMMLLFVVILTGFGILGYCAWGTAVQTVVLNELSGPFGSLVQISYIFAVVCTFPIAMFPTFTICEAKLFGDFPPSSRRKWLKNAFRMAVTLLMGLLAYQMAAYLPIFISMLGSFCSIPLAILFPAMLHLKIVGDAPILAWSLIVIGMVLIPLTLYVDILGML